jgi:hypothetical protein
MGRIIAPLYAAYAAATKARALRQPLDLDLPERRIVLDDDGKVVSVAFRDRLEAHRLIEEFMILANVAAAEELVRLRRPLLFRVHEEPSPEKLDALREVAEASGFTLAKGQVLIDPFTGQSLSAEDLSERLEPYKRRSGLTGEFDVPLGLYLQSAPPRDILARMLRNLKEIHRSEQDMERLLAVLDRLVALLPESWSEYRDRGLVHAERGQAALAAEDLQVYLAHAEDALDRDYVAERLADLRRASH